MPAAGFCSRYIDLGGKASQVQSEKNQAEIHAKEMSETVAEFCDRSIGLEGKAVVLLEGRDKSIAFSSQAMDHAKNFSAKLELEEGVTTQLKTQNAGLQQQGQMYFDMAKDEHERASYLGRTRLQFEATAAKLEAVKN